MADDDSEDLTGRMLNLFGRAEKRGRQELSRSLDAGRHQLELRQARRDLESFWIRLGKTAYRLSEADELEHPSIKKAVARIAELERRIEALEQGRDPDDVA